MWIQKETSVIIKPPPLVEVDSYRVQKRLESLNTCHSMKPYQHQKSALQGQLESYLWSLPDKKNLNIATPQDIVSFLIWRDRFGKTILHSKDCASSLREKDSCSCPRFLAAGMIDNNIGKLKTIFKELGRDSQWNDDLNVGNPAAHPTVKKYLLMVLEQQAQERVFSTQAIPIFLDKQRKICLHLREISVGPAIKPCTRYILLRDLAFFSIDFFSGDRRSDLGRVKSSDVLIIPGGKGFIFNKVFGKTLRGNGKNVFAVKPVANSPFCPVYNLKLYVALAKKMCIDLKDGFLFRATDTHGHVSESPFVGSAVGNRLIKHLSYLRIDNGETMHSFRSGCSLTLSLLGVSYERVAKHVGWKSVEMAIYYSQCDKVTSVDDPSSIISNESSVKNAATNAEELGRQFRDRNFLKAYSPLFS